MITKLDHAALSVADLDRSVRFYRDLLGFTVERIIESPPEMRLGEVVALPGCSARIAHLRRDVVLSLGVFGYYVHGMALIRQKVDPGELFPENVCPGCEAEMKMEGDADSGGYGFAVRYCRLTALLDSALTSTPPRLEKRIAATQVVVQKVERLVRGDTGEPE